MKNTCLVLLLLAISMALSACGNKGPLVLPDKPEAATAVPATSTPPATDTAPADQADKPAKPEPLPLDDEDD